VIFQSAMALSTISSRQRIGQRGEELAPARRGAGQLASDDEGDLGLDLGLGEAAHRHLVAVEELHVVEQDAEVGLVHAQLLLHGARGQTDLFAEHTAALGQRGLGVELGHRIGGVDTGQTEGPGYRRDRPSLGACGAQGQRGSLQGVGRRQSRRRGGS